MTSKNKGKGTCLLEIIMMNAWRCVFTDRVLSMHYDDVLVKILDAVRLADKKVTLFVLERDPQQVRNSGLVLPKQKTLRKNQNTQNWRDGILVSLNLSSFTIHAPEILKNNYPWYLLRGIHRQKKISWIGKGHMHDNKW